MAPYDTVDAQQTRAASTSSVSSFAASILRKPMVDLAARHCCNRGGNMVLTRPWITSGLFGGRSRRGDRQGRAAPAARLAVSLCPL